MYKVILEIDGMACSMCKSHVNDAVRKAVKVKKVTSSHRKNQTEIIAEEPLDEVLIKKSIEDGGYKVLKITQEPYVKKGLFGRK